MRICYSTQSTPENAPVASKGLAARVGQIASAVGSFGRTPIAFKKDSDGAPFCGVGIAAGTHGGSYTGNFHKGVPHGEGAYTFPNGDRCEGVFHKGQLPAHGRLFTRGGGVYQGGLRHGKPHGEGAYRKDFGRAGVDTYEGQYKNGRKHGEGYSYCGNRSGSSTRRGIFRKDEFVRGEESNQSAPTSSW